MQPWILSRAWKLGNLGSVKQIIKAYVCYNQFYSQLQQVIGRTSVGRHGPSRWRLLRIDSSCQIPSSRTMREVGPRHRWNPIFITWTIEKTKFPLCSNCAIILPGGNGYKYLHVVQHVICYQISKLYLKHESEISLIEHTGTVCDVAPWELALAPDL